MKTIVKITAVTAAFLVVGLIATNNGYTYNPEAATGMVHLALFAFLYFAPSFVARRRGHHNTSAIFVLNLLLGWTVLGWIGAMIWAMTEARPHVPA